MPELQQYEVNVFPNCKESLYVTAEFPPYTNSNSTKEAINQVASKPLLPHQLIPSTVKPSKPLNHKLTLSSSGQCTPVTNVASKPIVPSAEIKTVSSSKKQRRIYSNISDLKLSPSTASSSSPIFEFRNGIQYELAPVEYFDKTVSVPPCASPSPTTSWPTLSGPKKSFVTQVASKPIHPAQLGSRALSTPPIVPGNHLIAPVTVPVIASGFTASGQIGSDSLGCSGRALSTPPPFLPTSRIPYGVSGLPLRPAVGISPFISRDYNCGTPIINTSLGFPLNANLRGHLNSQINTAVVPNINLLSSALGAACSPTTSASFVRPIQVTARTPLPILPITQNRCIVGAVSALPPCPTSCPPSCPLPCQLPIPAPYPKPCASQPCRPTELPRLSNNNLVFSGFGQIETVGSDYNNLESECRTTFKLGKLSRCGQRAKVYLGPPVHSLLSGRPFC